MIEDLFDALANGASGDVYGTLAPLYRALYADRGRIDGQAGMVERAVPDAAAVAEVGCGSGDLCARLRTTYDRVLGVDPSAEMARLSRQAAGGVVCRGSAAALAPESVDAVVMLGTVLGHVHPVDAARDTLEAAATALRSGGRVILSVHDIDHVTRGGRRERTTTASGHRITQRDRWRPGDAPDVFEWDVTYELTRLSTGESVETVTSVPIRAFSASTLRRWIEDAGLRVVEIRHRQYIDGEADRAFVAIAERSGESR